nr:hypothetical protein [Tanacetum cinerariifolium]
MIVAQQAADVADECDVGVNVDDKIAQTLEITKLKQRVKKLERGIIANIYADEDVTLKDVAAVVKDVAVVEKITEIEENADDNKLEPAELKEVVEVVTTAKLMTEVVTAGSVTITAATTLITAATITAAPSATRRRKGVVIRDPEEAATPSIIVHFEPKSKDKGKGVMVKEPKPLKKQARIEQDEAYRKEKEDNVVMRYQALKRKTQTEAQARKNMMIYLRNMARFKMDYFKGISYDDIRPIFEKYFNSNVAFLKKTKEQMEEQESRALKRKTESQAVKAANKQKLDEEDKIAQTLEITKLKQRVKKLESRNKLKVSKLRRLKRVRTAQRDEDVTLKDVAAIVKDVAVVEKITKIEENADDDKLEPVDLKEVVEVVTTAKLMTEVVTAGSATITAATTPITAATITAALNKGKGIMVEEPKPLKKQARIEQRKEKEDNVMMRYQALKRKTQTEAQAKKNMMIYLRNMARFKMDYFKGIRYDDIRPIFEKYFNSNVAFLKKTKEQLEEQESRALKRKTESQAVKAAKKQKLDEEVPVVDYEIYTQNNKPYYKIIRADGSPQLFLSFLSLLRNFDREDLEVLWQLVKERFASSKPKNFLDDFLLTTLTYMFEKHDVKAQVWKNQRTVHGLAKTYCCQYKLMLMDNAVDTELRLLKQSVAVG